MNDQNISAELIAANHKLAIQHKEIALRATELILANKELQFQNEEKEKRAAELIIANKELQFQNEEKEKRASELIIANKELQFQNNEKEKRANELVTANIELAFQNREKESRSFELMYINNELRKAELYQKEYTKGLEEIIHIVSHKVRHPICQILGIANLIGKTNSKDEVKTMNSFIKQSAYSLDFLTKDLSKIISRLKNRGTVSINRNRFLSAKP